MSKEVPFDKEKFLNACSCGCTKERQVILDKIEQYRESEPVMVRYLEWYRDRLWQDVIKNDNWHKMRVERGDKQLNKDAAAALRAMADKLEQPGMHFMVGCVLPRLPIFDGEDDVERWCSYIEVSLMAGPIGG
jgi:hypothetical protein